MQQSRFAAKARTLTLSLLAPLMATAAVAQSPPGVSRVRPLGWNPGATTSVVVAGSKLADDPRLWTTLGVSADRVALPEGQAAADDRADFAIPLPPGAGLGLHGLRIQTSGGASDLRLFVVDDLPGVAKAGGNASPDAAQSLTTPCAVSGAIDNLQRDYYRIDARAGQRVALEVFARRLGSPLDPTLVLYDDQGRELASADDTPALGGDCQLVHRFDRDGAYLLELRDVRYSGGENHEYYLRIGDFPCVQGAVPLQVQRGTETSVDFAGIDLENVGPVTIAVPSDWPHDWYPAAVRRSDGSTSGFTTVAVSGDPQIVEQEPNDTLDGARRVTLGQGLNGRLQSPSDRDRYVFSATKGQRFVFQGVTRQEGLPTDLVLALSDAAGQTLARADDDGVQEGRLNHTFAADGDYVLEVSDLLDRGGPEYAYGVKVSAYAPGFDLALDDATVNAPAGGQAAFTVQATRRDYNGAIQLSVEGLPEGYTAPATRIGAGLKLAVLTIAAPPEAPRIELSSLRVVGTAEIGGQAVRSVATTAAFLQGRWNNAPVVPPPAREALALASAPAGRLALRIEPAEVVFGQHLNGTVRVMATRGDGLDGEITLATNPEKEALPGNVSLELKPIPQGQSEVTLSFSANEKAPLGEFSLVLTGSIKQDKRSVTATTPVINYALAPPFVLEVTPDSKQVARGGSLPLLVRVRRNPAFQGAVKLTWKDLPAGVAIPATVVAVEQTAVEVLLSTTGEAATGGLPKFTLEAVAAENDKLTASAPGPQIQVE